ncbi:hypothetical protein AC1031_017341 [Aphanomyces cochlioides]|nr:hypothetical protein AC1031_017341 [Aphanomyces cochlioides]
MVSLHWIVALAAIVAPSLQSSCSSIESDVDYTGPDLRSVAASAPEDCCGICADDSQCNAFSHYLGVCYLKSAKGNPISKAGVRSGTLAPPPSQCSAIENDVDYSGADLRSVAASVAEDCCAICADDAKCKAFSHYLGVCYLKSAKGNPVVKSGVRSAALAPPTSQCSAIENDVDFSGSDLRSVGASAAEGCCAICAGDAKCKAFSHYLGVCYLKSAKGNAIAKPGVRSATVSPSASQCSPMENDIDYSGGDLVSIASGAAEDCCAICKATSGCKLYSHAGGVCYLKNAVGSRVSKSGVRSALLSSAITTWVPTPTPTTPPKTTTIPPTPKTTLPLTPRPAFACTEKRQRRSWSSLSLDDKELYLSAVEEAMRRGLFKQFDQVNSLMDLLGDGHDSCGYFFWHRKFLLAYENMLRSLGPQYACVTLAYWDFTEDYLKFEQGKCKTIVECAPVTLEWGGSTYGYPAGSGDTYVTNYPMHANYKADGRTRRGAWQVYGMPFDWNLPTIRSTLFSSSSIVNVSHEIQSMMSNRVFGPLRGDIAIDYKAANDPLYYLLLVTVDYMHASFYHCKVEGLNLDDHGQQTHPSSFESCTIRTLKKIEPTSKIDLQSRNDNDDKIPVEQDNLIGQFFSELPQEYYKFTDIRSLGYSYEASGPIGTLYSTCEVPSTASPTPTTILTTKVPTPRPTIACSEKRQRRSWNSLSPDDKELYLSAVELAMSRGLFGEFEIVHADEATNQQGYNSCGYFFWHRKFLLAYESMLRSLDPKYACLTLAYWDFTEDYTNFEHGKCKTIAECSPVTQDWGGSTNGVGMSKDEIDVINRPMNSSNGLAVLRGRWHEFAMPNWTISTVQSALRGSSSIGNFSHQIETGIDATVRGNLKGSLAVNRGNSLDPLFFLHFATIDLIHSIFYHCNVEGINLDDQGQRTHPSSFESCSITTSNGKTTAIEPTSEILFQSAVNIYEEPFPISRNRGIGKFFTELPREYYKLADIRSLGYSYDLASSIGKLYSTCGTA